MRGWTGAPTNSRNTAATWHGGAPRLMRCVATCSRTEESNTTRTSMERMMNEDPTHPLCDATWKPTPSAGDPEPRHLRWQDGQGPPPHYCQQGDAESKNILFDGWSLNKCEGRRELPLPRHRVLRKPHPEGGPARPSDSGLGLVDRACRLGTGRVVLRVFEQYID